MPPSTGRPVVHRPAYPWPRVRVWQFRRWLSVSPGPVTCTHRSANAPLKNQTALWVLGLERSRRCATFNKAGCGSTESGYQIRSVNCAGSIKRDFRNGHSTLRIASIRRFGQARETPSILCPRQVARQGGVGVSLERGICHRPGAGSVPRSRVTRIGRPPTSRTTRSTPAIAGIHGLPARDATCLHDTDGLTSEGCRAANARRGNGVWLATADVADDSRCTSSLL